MRKIGSLTLSELQQHPDKAVRTEAVRLFKLLELLQEHEEEKKKLLEHEKVISSARR